MYIKGDLIIPAIFDIHYRGTGPFNCGNIRTRNGFLNSEAFAYTLEYINSGVNMKMLKYIILSLVKFLNCDWLIARPLKTNILECYQPLSQGTSQTIE
jgi:hypothetical protein